MEETKYIPSDHSEAYLLTRKINITLSIYQKSCAAKRAKLYTRYPKKSVRKVKRATHA